MAPSECSDFEIQSTARRTHRQPAPFEVKRSLRVRETCPRNSPPSDVGDAPSQDLRRNQANVRFHPLLPKARMPRHPTHPTSMPWLDRSKGKLDYVLASTPLASLIFVVVAYFHTVHPHFTKQEELSRAQERIASLERTVAEREQAVASLTRDVSEATARLTSAQLQSHYLAERLRDALPDGTLDEIQRAAMGRFYSADAAVAAYVELEIQPALEDVEGFDDASVQRQVIEPKGASHRRYLYLTHLLFCGSGGCTGPLFEEEFGSYCFVAWAHSRTLEALVEHADLPCSDLSDGRWLDDMAESDARGTRAAVEQAISA